MKNINGKTRVCGLLANPVEHTLSPFIQNHLAEKMKTEMAYVPFKAEEEGLKNAVEGAYALNILGLNISVPYKEKIIEYLKEIEPDAKEIGAVNTLVRIEGGYKGYNTDYLGLKLALESDGFIIKQREILVLGAGGASKAVLHLCGLEEAKKVYLLNRTKEKAEKTAQKVNKSFQREFVTAMGLEEYQQLKGEGYLAVQTTKAGMYPDIENTVIEDEYFYKRLSGAYDIVYNPVETKFMKNAEKAGAKTANGLKMLLYQGILAFELWSQKKVQKDTIEEVYSLLQKEIMTE